MRDLHTTIDTYFELCSQKVRVHIPIWHSNINTHYDRGLHAIIYLLTNDKVRTRNANLSITCRALTTETWEKTNFCLLCLTSENFE